jgi:1-deoxy-D-xylulose-5-phosphate reductoisomerase
VKLKRLAILGSTGSIGRQAVEVASHLPHIRICALAAKENWRLLAGQAADLRPEVVAMADEPAAAKLRKKLGRRAAVLCGPDAMTEMIRRCRPDIVLTAVVGTAGLAPTLAAIDCGADLAIANKESLVMAGSLVMRSARRAGVSVLPVDSEHSAILQCLAAGRRSEVRRIVITASGGALRDRGPRAAETASVAEALNHPTWRMGPKITIDSATLINKALEVVEAHWLFGLPPDRIGVVLHPESIVHSYVEFHDGSVIAQMGHPDMSLPIAYALSHPRRFPRESRGLDLADVGRLTFHRLEGRFARAVELGFEAIRRGGSAGAVLNGANEAAVEAFLAGRIKFGRIVPMVEDILRESPVGRAAGLQDLLAADEWARRRVSRKIQGVSE